MLQPVKEDHMSAKTKKAAVISIFLLAVGLVGAVVSFIFFPSTIHLTKEIRCYSGQSGVSDNYMDITCNIDITKHWFLTTDISGFVETEDGLFMISNWQQKDGDYHCALQWIFSSAWFNTDTEIFVLGGDLDSVRLRYDGDKYFTDDNAGNAFWYGSANSDNEFSNVLLNLGN